MNHFFKFFLVALSSVSMVNSAWSKEKPPMENEASQQRDTIGKKKGAVASKSAPIAKDSAPKKQATPEYPVNPYFQGFQPTNPAAVFSLPAIATNQFEQNTAWVAQTIVSVPGKIVDSLPSVKTVYPTGGRPMIVANIKCPAEVLTGQYLAPTNLLRGGINGIFEKLNEAEVFSADIQLVCG